METKERRTKQRSAGTDQNATVKGRVNRWISRSPKLEKFVDNTGYYIKHPEKFTERINEVYNNATSKGEYRTLAEFGTQFQALYRMARLTITGEYTGVPKGQLFLGLFGLVYLISPIDIVPDFLPFIGFADDAAFMLWLIRNAAHEVEKFQAWEQSQQSGAAVGSVNPAY